MLAEDEVAPPIHFWLVQWLFCFPQRTSDHLYINGCLLSLFHDERQHKRDMNEKKRFHSTAFHYLNLISRIMDSFTLSSQVLNLKKNSIGFTAWVGEQISRVSFVCIKMTWRWIYTSVVIIFSAPQMKLFLSNCAVYWVLSAFFT